MTALAAASFNRRCLDQPLWRTPDCIIPAGSVPSFVPCFNPQLAFASNLCPPCPSNWIPECTTTHSPRATGSTTSA